MTKIKTFNVYNEIYGQNLHVILGMPQDKVRSYLEKKFKIVWDYGDNKGMAGSLFEFDKAPYSVLWLKKLPKDDFIPKLAHEIYHYVLRLSLKVGISTYPEIDGVRADEASAYLMEFYMREILRRV